MELNKASHLISKAMFICNFIKFIQLLNIIKFTPVVDMVIEEFAPASKFKLAYVKNTLLFLLLNFYCPIFSQSNSIEDIKKEAEKQFKEENYNAAYKLYSQLTSNFPKEPEYNFKLGVCMIYSEPNKKKCIEYLKFAVNNPNESTEDAQFYLAKAYHINYLFDEAISNYRLFKSNANKSQLKKFAVDREIQSCENGKHLLSNLTDVDVISKVVLPESDYFRSYKKIGGKLLVKPDDFKTKLDKKNKEKSIVFLPNESNVVYYSSYGETGETGKDIYTAVKMPDGTYSAAKKVEGINTEFDEDYPFLHPNGTTLYFASKGFNSMGGYDIFKSVFNEETNSWSQPVNLEFPINSPDDDYLFVTDSLETTAFFSTGRQSPPGKIDVLKVKTKRRPLEILALKGEVLPGDPEYDLNCSIVVKDLFDQKEIGTYTADENGKYKMELPNGGKFVFIVETNGVEKQSSQVTLPMASVSKPCRQSISYQNGKLNIVNYFDEPSKDSDYLDYLDVIEKKAKLEVNEGEARPESPEGSESPVAASNTTKKPTLVEENTSENVSGQESNITSKQAKQDASIAKTNAAQFMRDYIAANEAAIQHKEGADKQLNEATDAINAAESLTDETEKKDKLTKAESLKQTAEKEQIISNSLVQFASAIDADAKRNEQLAELNTTYAEELEKKTNAPNSTSNEKVTELGVEIKKLSEQKKSTDEYFESTEAKVKQLESQYSSISDQNKSIQGNIEEIQTAITAKEEELAGTKKKSAKQKINEEITQLNDEKKDKETQIVESETKLRSLENEIDALKTSLEMAGKISDENLSVAALDNAVNNKISREYLQEKYKTKILVENPSDEAGVSESNRQLSNYNKEIESLIASKKQELAKTKNANSKKELQKEITSLESLKKQNQQQIAVNNKNLKAISDTKAVAQESFGHTYVPLEAKNEREAVNKLEELTQELSVNEIEYFDYNNYQDEEAQKLKIDADTKINEAMARQKKLKEDIQNSKKNIETGSGATAGNASELLQASEELSSEARKKRSEAKSKSGAEKEQLLEEALTLEQQANSKNLEAGEIVRMDHETMFKTNSENITTLIATNKSTPSDIARAKALNEEAESDIKKANELRLEANSATTSGAKLGAISNAEDKELLALQKQKEAIELLQVSNPEIELKTALTSTSSAGDQNEQAPVNYKEELNKVNTELAALASVKSESYQKLNEANQTEIDKRMAQLKNNAQVEKTPALKTELLALEKKNESLQSFRKNAETSSNVNDKLNNLAASAKKQNELLKQLAVLNESLEAAPIADNSSNATSNTSEVPKNTNEETNDLTALADIVTDSSEENSILEQDTSAIQVVNYFEGNKSVVRNNAAGAQMKASLTQLKNLEAINASLTTEIQSAEKLLQASDAGISTIEDMYDYSEELEEEAEPIMAKSAALKKEAEGKSGEEKNYQLAQARQLELEAQDKLLQANEFKKQANDATYNTYKDAIDELLQRLNNDNPDLASEYQDRRDDYSPLKNQIRNLREEANSLNNKGARLGALSNVEDKELELLSKQEALLSDLKKQYPDYKVVPKLPSSPENDLANLRKKQSEVKQNEFDELTNLTNAFSLEYESSKNAVPQNLNSNQQRTKKRSEDLNSESKRLLIQSASVTDPVEKFQLLSMSAKKGKLAVDELNTLLPKVQDSDLAALAEIGTEIESANPSNSGPVTKPVSVNGLEIVKGNAYSAANPIPIDAPMADGLVFRVQIGAFRTQLPNNAFKGLSPLNGETTGSGYIRYTAGNFNRIEQANAVKNDLRNLGYSDAFVVVYYNGKRITLSEALAQMERDGIQMDPTAPQTAGITANSNVPKATYNAAIQEKVVVTKELEQMNGLLYTIQIGVYTKQVSKSQILSLRPVFREQLSNGLYRYTAGIYTNSDRLLTDKNKVVNMGVRDAFISAYYNGKRMSYAEAKSKQESESNIQLEAEDPIVFPAIKNEPPLNPYEKLLSTVPSAVEPFKNNVSEYPAATLENGVKEGESGISYKVQIGAFSKQVPADVAVKFSAIKNWPIENKQINGLFIYNVGNFTEARFAKSLKEEIVALGINDAFITVYRDGKKLYGPEAESYLR